MFTEDANIHLTGDDAKSFLQKLMHPPKETIEARRRFLEEPDRLDCAAIEEALKKIKLRRLS